MYTSIKERQLTGAPQFTFEDLFIFPFSEKRVYEPDGSYHYVPYEQNTSPTGIHIFDDYLRSIGTSDFNLCSFCDSHGINTRDLEGVTFMLTGMGSRTFRNKWKLQTAFSLLRYTDMTIAEVAKESGFGNTMSMHHVLHHAKLSSATVLRYQMRKEHDVGRYRP